MRASSPLEPTRPLATPHLKTTPVKKLYCDTDLCRFSPTEQSQLIVDDKDKLMLTEASSTSNLCA